MASDKKARAELGRTLEKARSKHTERLKKVEEARVRFEKQQRKLLALEADIADLTRRLFEPGAERLGQASHGDKSLRKARLIYNPKSGGVPNSSDRLQLIVRRLRAHGIIAEIDVKTSGKAARELASEAAENGEPLVIVAAGDGTIAEVASQP